MEMQGEPTGNENETKAEKFVRLGEYRMNKVVKAMGNLSILAIEVAMSTVMNRWI